MQPKEFGELCEMEFALEAMKRGLKVSKPMRTQKYDFIVDNGKELLRIQVKASRSINSKRYDSYGVMVSHGRDSKFVYNNDHTDYFAIFIEPLKIWYFLPVNFVQATKISIRPNSKESKYNQFKNAWHLIE